MPEPGTGFPQHGQPLPTADCRPPRWRRRPSKPPGKTRFAIPKSLDRETWPSLQGCDKATKCGRMVSTTADFQAHNEPFRRLFMLSFHRQCIRAGTLHGSCRLHVRNR
ncbi:uncharacterized protein UV8b_05420 [Ustilaginoidea virens]|uniref:Uncharacterized protein n=1 Tax=Ustilaginoidea virens TaxID=1159556 RepID=A0A8E5HTE8_USTVR|nr:uncharacterized protein UV8b_05420 [Ustilaginoidea virens]QUC21177.1 hypothetical protein UV8b_05420 [Ustilaginoidea virens]